MALYDPDDSFSTKALRILRLKYNTTIRSDYSILSNVQYATAFSTMKLINTVVHHRFAIDIAQSHRNSEQLTFGETVVLNISWCNEIGVFCDFSIISAVYSTNGWTTRWVLPRFFISKFEIFSEWDGLFLLPNKTSKYHCHHWRCICKAKIENNCHTMKHEQNKWNHYISSCSKKFDMATALLTTQCRITLRAGCNRNQRQEQATMSTGCLKMA